MAEKVFGFYEDVARQLRDLVRGGGDGLQPSSPSRAQGTIAIAICDAGGIPARTGTIAGSGTVTLCLLDDSGNILTTTITETVFNLSSSNVTGNGYIVINKEYCGGKWVVIYEDCQTGAS